MSSLEYEAKRRGALVIAHGSSKPEWVELVDRAVSDVAIGMPVVTSFLEMVEGRSILDGIHELESRGVNEIVAVPLFVSSGSTHIEEIRYLLGLTQHPKIEMDQPPFTIRAEVTLCQAMDDHPLINQILLERALEMSEQPEREVVLLVGHGSEGAEFAQLWESGMMSLAQQLYQAGGFARVEYATLHPDNLYERLQKLSQSNHVLVLPLFLSEGYFTRKVIPSRLEDLTYTYTGKTYLPSSLISRWIESIIHQEVAKQAVM